VSFAAIGAALSSFLGGAAGAMGVGGAAGAAGAGAAGAGATAGTAATLGSMAGTAAQVIPKMKSAFGQPLPGEQQSQQDAQQQQPMGILGYVDASQPANGGLGNLMQQGMAPQPQPKPHPMSIPFLDQLYGRQR
jgi:hypothetical protein